MSDRAQEFSTASGILQDFYGGFKNSLRDALPPLYAKLKPGTDKVSGQQFKFSIQTELPQGVGSALASTSVIPEAEPGSYLELAVKPTRIYGTLLFDRMMLLAAGQNSGGRRAYINYLENEMKGIKNQLSREIGRQLFGSASGVITVCGTTSGSLVVQLASTAKMQQFAVRGHIDLINTNTGVAITNGLNRIIQSVDVTNLTVTLDSAGGVVTTDSTTGVTRKGAYGAEMTGLADINSATVDIYGVTTAAQRRWKAYVNANTGAFDLKKVIKAGIAAGVDSGGDPDLIVTDADMQAQYWYQLTSSRTFDVAKSPIPVQKLSSGFYELSVIINGKECKWIADNNCPHSVMHLLNTEDIGLQHLAEPDFMKIGGEILLPNIYGTSGTATNKAVLEYYPQMICTRRNSHILMSGMTDIAGW